jgi:hypothetical protein
MEGTCRNGKEIVIAQSILISNQLLKEQAKRQVRDLGGMCHLVEAPSDSPRDIISKYDYMWGCYFFLAPVIRVGIAQGANFYLDL